MGLGDGSGQLTPQLGPPIMWRPTFQIWQAAKVVEVLLLFLFQILLMEIVMMSE